jgi:excisionase family DNA binding protein
LPSCNTPRAYGFTKQHTISLIENALDVALLKGIAMSLNQERWKKHNATAKNIESLGLNTVKAAKRIGVSRPTLSGMIKRNEIEYRRVGRRVLITELAIQRFLNGGEQ